jgi:hypothetical protein
MTIQTVFTDKPADVLIVLRRDTSCRKRAMPLAKGSNDTA